MAKKKKDKPLYDENGRWVEERGRIRGAIRRSYRLSPQVKETLEEARVELSPTVKKDGKPGKRNRVRYKCAMCNKLFQYKTGKTTNIQVDHIKTVVPLHKSESSMNWDEIVRGIYCNKDNLQALCSTPIKKNNGVRSCHGKKTQEENFLRKKWKEAQEEFKEFNMPELSPEYIKEKEDKWKKEYKIYLEEKEDKRLLKDERRRQKAAKREGNSSPHKGNEK